MNSAANGSPPRRNDRPLIFVVDDEPLLLELASTLLAPMDCEVKTFRNAESALAAYKSTNPRAALIITDYAMHRMNGLEFIQECRRIHPGQKILMVSGTVDETIYQDSPEKPDGFLAKPYRAKRFLDLVEGLLASET